MRCGFTVLMIALLTGCGGDRKASPVVPTTRARQADTAIVPAGSSLPLRTVSRIEPAASNQAFDAVVAGDVAGVIPSGSPARLVIRPEGLALSAVMIYGTWHAVSGTGNEAALLGTLVRGVIDTPRPGDPVTQSMAIRTSGADVQVPAGSLLIFRLDTALRLGTIQ